MTSVFLSYGRGDDEPFVERLCQALKARGLDVWYDRESLSSRGRTFHQEILDAIAARERLVLVVGPHAVASEYVRQEWQFALEADKVVTPILRVGDYPLVPDELKLLHCEDIRDDARFEFHLDNLARQLSEPPPPLGKLIAVPSLPPHYLARTERLKALRDAVRADLDHPVVLTGETARVGMHGMGGIGKSVLAAALVRDRLVREAFPDGIVWVGLGSLPTITELQRRVHRDLGGDGAIATEHEGKTKLNELLADKSVLLVLDDVWRRSDADAFNVLGPRCRALITTRDAGLLTSLVGTHHLVELFTNREAMDLLAHAAGVSPDALPSEANQIVAECGRLPLAVALCGGMVQGGAPWSDVLDALREHDLEYIADEHVLEAQHRSLWVAMEVSLHALPADEQQRFAELAVFAEETRIPEAAVITLWSHTGGLSDRKARALLIKLKQRSLVQLNRAGDAAAQIIGDISLHDLLRDFAIALVEQRFGGSLNLHNQLLAAYQKKCPNGWPSGPNDGYFFTRLRSHFVAAGRVPELADLLHDLLWLEAKNQTGLTFDLPFDFQVAIDGLPATDDRQRTLKLLDEALRRDLHFIDRHAQDYPQALFQCLWNTCWWYDCPEAADHYVPLKDDCKQTLPWEREGPKLFELLTGWRACSERSCPELLWLRTVRPPSVQLGTGQRAVLRGHESDVTSVSWSPDGTQIASGSRDKTVRVWDTLSGAVLHCFCGHEEAVMSVAYSPDGRRIVSGSWDKTVRVWDATSGAQIQCIRGHNDGVTSVSYSPDGLRILSGAADVVLVWNAKTGEELLRLQGQGLQGHQREMKSVAFSPDGAMILSEAKDKTVRILDAYTGIQLACFPGPWTSVASLSFAPDGQRIVVAAREKCLVRLWDLSSERCESEFYVEVKDNEEDFTTCLAMSPNGHEIVSGASDHTVRVWDAANGRQLDCLQGHEDQLTSVSFSPDGKWIVSGSMDGTVRMWARSGAEPLLRLREHDDQVNEVEFSQDGLWVASRSADCTVRVWSAANGKQLACLDGHRRGVWCVAFSSDGQRILSGEGGENVRLWDWANEKLLACLNGHGFGIRSIALAADGRRLVSAGKDWTVRVWDLGSYKQLAGLRGHKGYVDSVAFSPDGRRVVSGGHDGTIHVWDVESTEELFCLQGHTFDVHTVEFSPDGQRIISGDWKGLRVWDARNGAELAVLGSHDGHLEIATFSHDGRRIAGGFFQNAMRVWDATTFECLEVIRGKGDVSAIANGVLMFPWRALARSSETVIEDTATGLPIAWFPVALRLVSTNPHGRQWAGAGYNHLSLITLEGPANERLS